VADATWEEPLLAQVSQIDLSDATIAAVVAALGSGERPIALDRGRIDRQMRSSPSIMRLVHRRRRLSSSADRAS
jgi:hypothetical protein